MDKNDFALTPPMGWNSYDYYDTTVTEAEVRANAAYMAEHLKEYGWEYIVVDIAWYANDAGKKRGQFQYIPFGDVEMDAYGRLLPSPSRFPSSVGKGFAPLAEYVHGLGLKFGIHIMRGIPRGAAQAHLPISGCAFTADEAADPSSICGWNPDMYGVRDNAAGQAYYDSIFSMYAGWGVDFVKCDDICDSWLYREPLSFSGWKETEMIHRAIERCGREIVLSLSPGPAHIDRAWHYAKNANMWRITDDLWDKWEDLREMFRRCELWQDHVRQGCYPDCDMLPLGRIGRGFGQERECRLTREEQKAMMTLWCVFRSPLMLGGELTLLDEETKRLLTNRELLSLLRDGRRGRQAEKNDAFAIWVNEDVSGGETRTAKTAGGACVAVFNLKDEEALISADLEETLRDGGQGEYALYELWDKTECVTVGQRAQVKVPPHGVKVFSVRPVNHEPADA